MKQNQIMTTINIDVLQGSVLELLLFNIYIYIYIYKELASIYNWLLVQTCLNVLKTKYTMFHFSNTGTCK